MGARRDAVLRAGRPFPLPGRSLAATLAAILSKNLAEPRGGGEVAALVLTMLRKHPDERPDAATVAAVLRRVASGGRAATTRLPDAPRQDGPAAQEGTGRRATAAEPPRAPIRLTPLHGVPALTAAKIVSDWPTERAVTDLLALDERPPGSSTGAATPSRESC